MIRCLWFSAFGALLASALTLALEEPPHRGGMKAIQPGQVHLVDIAEQAGLNLQNVYGSDRHKEFIIETTGNGAVIFDYDNDGWPDIFLPNGSTVEGFPNGEAPTGHLYHNNHDGTFSDVTKAAGLVRSGWGQGGCVGDYDDDGVVRISA
jgi:hypothetical protein